MDFGKALSALKSGYRITRSGWNGKGMYVYYVPMNKYKSLTEAAKEEFGEYVPYRAYLAIRTAEGDVATWSPSCSDVLAEDWTTI